MESLNLGILAHVDAGKTSLTERLLYEAGVIAELGSVDRGNTQTDSLSLERQRGITIRSAVASFEVSDVCVNLIDTPGHPDFIAEVERVLGVLDGAVLVISAVEGVQAQTRILMKVLRRLAIPTAIFVNKIDRRGADGGRTLQSIKERLTTDAVPMGYPIEEGTRQAGYHPYGESDSALIEAASNALSQIGPIEAVASRASILADIYTQSRNGLVHPVYFGSAVTGAGVEDLTSHLTDLFPTADSNVDGPPAGTVFKIERDASNRRIAYIRLFSGAVTIRQELSYGDDDQLSRVTGIDVFQPGGAKRSSRVIAGQIAKLQGLRTVRVGDSLGEHIAKHEAHQFQPPTLETSVVAVDASQTVALGRALDQLADQDPLINLRPEGSGLLALSLYGEVQKEVIQDTLRVDYGIEVEFRNTTTINVERPLGIGMARESLGKGGNPFLATIGLRVEPAAPGSGVQVELEVKVDSLPLYVYKSVDEFQDSLDSVVRDALKQGLYGWEVIDCVVTLVESGYSAPGTKASDIRYLTPLVLFSALRQAETTVCQPVSTVRLELPVDALAPASSAIAKSGGAVIDAEMGDGLAILRGEIPTSALQRLQQLLPGISHGEGIVEASFARYEATAGPPPIRPRTDDNPLNRREYLSRVNRAGRVGQREGDSA